MAIEDWMTALKYQLAQVKEIKQVYIYDELPGNLPVFPCMVIMPLSGTQMIGGAQAAIYRVQATLYFSAQILPEAYAKAVPYVARVRKKILEDVTLGGLVQYIQPASPPEPWFEGPGGLAYMYSDKVHVGILFRLDVKELNSDTIA